MVISPATRGTLSSQASVVKALTFVLDHVIEIFVVVHPAQGKNSSLLAFQQMLLPVDLIVSDL